MITTLKFSRGFLSFLFVLATVILMSALATGCTALPKNAYMRGVKSTINTPWGPSTMEAAEVATGTAARNITLDKPAK